MKDVMSEDNTSMRRKAFEKTGCLLTWIPNNVHDESHHCCVGKDEIGV